MKSFIVLAILIYPVRLYCRFYPEMSLLEFLHYFFLPLPLPACSLLGILLLTTADWSLIILLSQVFHVLSGATRPSKLHYVILTSLLFQDVQNIVWTKWKMWSQREKSCRLIPREAALYDSKILSYIKQCIQLSWRMVTQVPALEIEYQSVYLGQNHKKIGYHSSPEMMMSTKTPTWQEPAEEEIACYLWPGLLDGNGTLIRAGEVLCKSIKRL